MLPKPFHRMHSGDQLNYLLFCLKFNPQTSLHGEHAFRFSKVFRSDAKQTDVFEEVGQPMVDHCMDGYSACVFAYGQTGSGKTYSMFGDAANQGVIPR